MKTTTSGLVTARQIESARQSIARKLSRRGKLWVRVYPSLPITAKPSEVRMGKGKGMVNHWAARVKAGQILFEVCGVENPLVIQAFRIGGAKLSVKTIICH